MFEPGTQSEAKLKRWRRNAKRDRYRAATLLKNVAMGSSDQYNVKERKAFIDTAELLEAMIERDK
jgi:hypothetical protein